MAQAARAQFLLDVGRIDLWVDACFVRRTDWVWGTLFQRLPPLTAWRTVEAVSQGTLAEWYRGASETFARASQEHLLPHERQRVAVDTVHSVVTIEKEFRVVDLTDVDHPVWQPTMRLYLEVDCKQRRRIRSAWQSNVEEDGILLLPWHG